MLHRLQPVNLAQVGFCYIGEGDACFCPWCEIIIDHWGFFDEPFAKHKEVSSTVCHYLNYLFPAVLLDVSSQCRSDEESVLVIDESR